ncbi:MAG: zinc ribbon domain-containing protein [Candidatus Aminicenantia bacterium]
MGLSKYEKKRDKLYKRILIYLSIAFLASALTGWLVLKFSGVNVFGVLGIFIFILVVLTVALVILDYIYHDAKRRGMNPWLWLLIIIFVPYFIGLIIYLLFRKPKLNRCTQCGNLLPAEYIHCPQCGSNVKSLCPQCKKTIEPNQNFCPYCGYELKVKN